MTLDQSNMFSESFSIVKTFLKDNVTDPRNRFKANWIHDSMPLITDKGFNGYPFIIIKNDVSEDSATRGKDGQTSNKIFRVQLRVMSDQGKEIDSISDLIGQKFNDETLLTEFPERELSSSPIDWDLDMNGKKVLFRNIGLIFGERI